MIKENILNLLAGDSFSGYLSGMEMLCKNIKEGKLPDADLDQDIIERACAVLILERWMQHDDYIAALEKFVDKMPKYAYLLSNEDVGDDLKGLALFINGLGQGECDLSGFIYASHSGYLMSATAAEEIANYCTEQQDSEAAEFFTETAEFFNNINSAQFGIISAMMSIKTWNESMADGFYNILTSSDMSTQSWMLGSLYTVINDPVVKTHIFGRYMKVLNTVKEKYVAEENAVAVEQLEEMIKMVTEKSEGK